MHGYSRTNLGLHLRQISNPLEEKLADTKRLMSRADLYRVVSDMSCVTAKPDDVSIDEISWHGKYRTEMVDIVNEGHPGKSRLTKGI